MAVAAELSKASATAKSQYSILVNKKQTGNPLLKFLRAQPWEYSDKIIADYQINANSTVIFLSLRYHAVYPNYVVERMSTRQEGVPLRILLALVDTKEYSKAMCELSTVCVSADFTLIVAMSNEDAARYLEQYKMLESKPSDSLLGRAETDFHSQVSDVLTTIKSVNKTDASNLMRTFGSLKGILNASKDQLKLLPGFGQKKVEELYALSHAPFLNSRRRADTTGQLSIATYLSASQELSDKEPENKLPKLAETDS